VGNARHTGALRTGQAAGVSDAVAATDK
jgi:hypothetical protein